MVSLTLNLDDKTVRKLRALAMLSGKTVAELENEFSQYFDRLLTQEIAEHLDMVAPATGNSFHVEGTPVQEKSVKYAQQEAEYEENPPEPLNGDLDHSLSGDADEGQESLEEQFTRESGQEVMFKPDVRGGGEDAISFNHLRFPDAGQDSEAFLDEVLGEPQYQDEYDHVRRERPTAARMGAGAGKKPRVKVGAFTGDESSSF